MNTSNIDIQELDNGLDFYFLESRAYVIATSIKENGRGIEAELDIERPPQTPVKTNIKLHLYDHAARMKLADELNRTYLDEYLPWAEIIEFVSSETIKRYRYGEPMTELWTNQDAEPPQYIIKPIIEQDVANIVFGEQSSAKTIVAYTLSFLSLLGQDNPFTLGLDVRAGTHEVLVLDYENNRRSTLWYIKCLQRGMDWPDIGLKYRRCFTPLATDVDTIRQTIKDNNVSLVIIDSLGIAAGGELKEAGSAINFYSALRSLNVTSLILAHTSKGVDKTKTVFGSIYFENLARNIWEIQKLDISDNIIRVALHHQKSNFSKKFPSIGLEYAFDLDKISVTTCNPAEESTFREKMSIAIRIEKELEQDSYSAKDLSDLLGEKLNSVTHALDRLEEKGKVKKANNIWELC